MNNNLVFKIVSICLITISLILSLFLFVSVILAICKTIVLSNLHFVVFIILVSINITFLIYNLIVITNKKTRS